MRFFAGQRLDMLIYLFSFLQFDLKFGFQFMFFDSLVSNLFFLHFDSTDLNGKKTERKLKKLI